ncbi:MAG: hypothetical protein WC620_01930 [Methanoregula sp.]
MILISSFKSTIWKYPWDLISSRIRTAFACILAEAPRYLASHSFPLSSSVRSPKLVEILEIRYSTPSHCPRISTSSLEEFA